MSAPPGCAERRGSGWSDARCEHLMDLYWSEMMRTRTVVALAEYHPELAVSTGGRAACCSSTTRAWRWCEEHAAETGHRLPVSAPAYSTSHQTDGDGGSPSNYRVWLASGSKGSVRRDCEFRHRRLKVEGRPGYAKLRAFFCTGPRRPAVHRSGGARPSTRYLIVGSSQSRYRLPRGSLSI